jgi:PHP family Zn ribbon phosphoesterase
MPLTTLRDGLRFKKLDLHLHTPASVCFADKRVTANDIVKAALSAGLDGIAVTDHNSGAFIDLVKTAAKGTPLIVFPGVELTCMTGKEGVHLIALFDPSAGKAEIESLLGNLGLTPDQYGNEDTVVTKVSTITVAQIITERGGLAVLAHANSTRGVLADMRGQQRIELLRSPFIVAAEATDFQDAAAKAARKRVVDLLDGNDPSYKRKLAVYQASDNPSGTGNGKHAVSGIGTRCSYLKLDQINIDGLRQCFADPDVRIRQDFEFTVIKYPRIVKLNITGGFLDGESAVFHSGLNSILGAKGTGKSLLVEFLRFALNQPPKNGEILDDYKSKLESRLDNYGSVELILSDETGREFSVTRVYNPAEDNPYKGIAHLDVAQLFPVLFLSQNEIIKIAENEAEQIAFIDQFFDFRSFQSKIDEEEARLSSLDASLAEALRAVPDLKTTDQQLVTIAKDIEHLDQALKNPVFDEFNATELKDRAVREQSSYIAAVEGQVSAARKTVEVLQPPQIPESYKDDPSFKRLGDINKALRVEVLVSLDALTATVAESQKQFTLEYEKWSPQFGESKKAYEDAIKKEGADYRTLAQKRAKRVKDLEALQQKQSALKQRTDGIKELSAQRTTALEGLKAAHEEYTRERQARCAKIETEAQGRLKVSISESSNRDEFKARLLALKRGSYLKETEIDKICQGATSEQFVKAVVRFGIFRELKTLEALSTAIGIDFERMRGLAEFLVNTFPLEDLLALEYKALPQDRPEILYNVGGAHYEPLKRLSVGQKCTAMLIIALSEGSAPIVIDQPEDSLDIRSIWEDMCTKIRSGKDKRQFIFTTHSSSLAVASDTDKFIVMEADATKGRVVFSGSMDHSPVSDEVLKYLEGGKRTYSRKFEKYRVKALD